jgi:hypothetical protein
MCFVTSISNHRECFSFVDEVGFYICIHGDSMSSLTLISDYLHIRRSAVCPPSHVPWFYQAISALWIHLCRLKLVYNERTDSDQHFLQRQTMVCLTHCKIQPNCCPTISSCTACTACGAAACGFCGVQEGLCIACILSSVFPQRSRSWVEYLNRVRQVRTDAASPKQHACKVRLSHQERNAVFDIQ